MSSLLFFLRGARGRPRCHTCCLSTFRTGDGAIIVEIQRIQGPSLTMQPLALGCARIHRLQWRTDCEVGPPGAWGGFTSLPLWERLAASGLSSGCVLATTLPAHAVALWPRPLPLAGTRGLPGGGVCVLGWKHLATTLHSEPVLVRDACIWSVDRSGSTSVSPSVRLCLVW